VNLKSSLYRKEALKCPPTLGQQGRRHLTLYYFDQETTGDDPKHDRIVTAQYQRLDDNLEPAGPFTIMVEWEWGEKQVLQMLLDKGILQSNWDFVPVGNRLCFDIAFLIERATKWNLIQWDMATLKYYWFVKPVLDLQPVLVLMNRGKFTGSRLHAFAEKEPGARIPILYHKGAYAEIIEYVTQECEAALGLLRETRDLLGDFGDRRHRTTL
jgi:hypothetical protein